LTIITHHITLKQCNALKGITHYHVHHPISAMNTLLLAIRFLFPVSKSFQNLFSDIYIVILNEKTYLVTLQWGNRWGPETQSTSHSQLALRAGRIWWYVFQHLISYQGYGAILLQLSHFIQKVTIILLQDLDCDLPLWPSGKAFSP